MSYIYLNFCGARVNSDGTITLVDGEERISLREEDVKDLVEELKSEAGVSFGEIRQ